MASKDRIPPGGEGKINVTLKTGSYDGNVKKTVKVKSNDPKTKTLILTVKTFVQTDLKIDPKKLKFYPKTENEVITYDIALTNKLKDQDIEINSIEIHYNQPPTPTSDFIELINADEIKNIKPEQTLTLKTILKKDAPKGRFNGNIIIKTNLKPKSNFTIRFFGKIPGEEQPKEQHPKQPKKPQLEKPIKKEGK